MGKLSEIFNFDNIGSKIKNFVERSCWISIILLWISEAIAFFALIANEWTAYLCWIPLVAAVVGPFLIWLSSWLLYAFGEMVEDIHAMRNNYYPIAGEQTKGTNNNPYNINIQSSKFNEPSAKAKKYMSQEIMPKYEGNGYICPSCKMVMDYIAPCERCGYVPPQAD